LRTIVKQLLSKGKRRAECETLILKRVLRGVSDMDVGAPVSHFARGEKNAVKPLSSKGAGGSAVNRRLTPPCAEKSLPDSVA
jgi:hypothetical protein